jgi:hypothetical protein
MIKNVHWSSREVHVYSYEILIKIEDPRRSFEKSSNIKFLKNPSSGNRVVPCGQADRRTEGRRTDRETDRQTGRQADRQAGITNLNITF